MGSTVLLQTESRRLSFNSIGPQQGPIGGFLETTVDTKSPA